MAEQKTPPEQIEIFEIPSPCRGICQANNRGYCLGCLRSREERFYWNQLSDAQKRHVINLCNQRRRRIAAKGQASPENTTTDQQQFDF